MGNKYILRQYLPQYAIAGCNKKRDPQALLCGRSPVELRIAVRRDRLIRTSCRFSYINAFPTRLCLRISPYPGTLYLNIAFVTRDSVFIYKRKKMRYKRRHCIPDNL